MEISDNILSHIEEEAKRVHHGSITIELNETKDKIDVITESRKRFPNNEEKSVKEIKEKNVIRKD